MDEFVYNFLDADCTIPDTNTTRPLECAGMLGGRFASGQGVCNTDPSRLPLPAGTFVTQV